MTVNTTHPRPDALLDSARARVIRPRRPPRGARDARHGALAPWRAARPEPPPRGPRAHRRATEAEGSQGAAPARGCFPRFDTAGATRASYRRVTFSYRFPSQGSDGMLPCSVRFWRSRLVTFLLGCRVPSVRRRCTSFSSRLSYVYYVTHRVRNVTPFLTRGWMFCRPLALVLAPRLTGLTTVPPDLA